MDHGLLGQVAQDHVAVVWKPQQEPALMVLVQQTFRWVKNQPVTLEDVSFLLKLQQWVKLFKVGANGDLGVLANQTVFEDELELVVKEPV